jgi:hypothetical protein
MQTVDFSRGNAGLPEMRGKIAEIPQSSAPPNKNSPPDWGSGTGVSAEKLIAPKEFTRARLARPSRSTEPGTAPTESDPPVRLAYKLCRSE